VSVGQKLLADQFPGAPPRAGGYVLDGNGGLAPNSGLLAALHATDAGIGRMVTELQNQGLADSTLIIISAKHGNSPIDLSTLFRVPVATLTSIVNSVATGLLAIPPVADTGPLVWLTPAGQARIDDIMAAFNASIGSGNPAHISGVLAKGDLAAIFADPLTDVRAPDLILLPIPGTLYSLTSSKIADHGSFNEDDVHVALLVSNPTLPNKTIDDPVETRQIACTILKALAMECDGLQSEQIEPSKFLPNSNHKNTGDSGASALSKKK
jgi:arylsulfatase A-like enzyme